ncbi:DUF7373 family lipoprotein [Tsukamurella tyrosinosolvens]|uniref:DUF7373 family lipoprotein n=1 Tax=Tsukamurella tyrosinosolvens TaxID=57704 RepID=UPI0011C04532|nr:hypothetical protein [Tsukamurella tyrosinosolvens]MEC4611776.1 hypothetical protein [Tsukamurella tyrosinosolvens]
MKRRGLIGITMALSATLTGCSASIPGTPVAAPGVSARLDTGNFPTTPRVVGLRRADDARVQGSHALLDYLVSPAELDARFDESAYVPISVLPDAEMMPLSLGTKMSRSFWGHVGAVNDAQKIKGDSTTALEQQINTVVVRFPSQELAQLALERLRSGFPPANGVGTPLAKYPAAFEGGTPEKIGGSPMIWMQYKDFITGVGFINVQTRETIEGLAASYFDKQLPRLDQVPFSAEATANYPDVDRDGIMRRTRLANANPNGVYYATGWMTPHAWAMSTSGSWKQKIDMYRRAGIDLVGHSANTIFRATDPEGAQLFKRLDQEAPKSAGDREEGSAPGVPGSWCISGLTTANGAERRYYACAVIDGRYIAVDDASTLTAAQQGVAASYLVLKATK